MKRDFSDLTLDIEVSNTDYYQTIVGCFRKLDEYHTLSRFTGYCLAASDIISKMLIQQGIGCRIVECELMVTWNHESDDEYIFVGFDDALTPKEVNEGKIDTHAIIITDTEIPILIDASISHHLPSDRPYVVERTHRTTVDPTIIAEYQIGNCNLRYFIKKKIKWPALETVNIIDRLNTEKQINKKVSLLQKLIIVAVGIGIINAIVNLAILI